MFKYMILVSILAVSMIFASGCSDPGETADDIEPVEIFPVEIGDLPSEIEEWVEESKYKFGGHTRIYEDQLYILAAYGERPTGGYDVEITEIIEKNEKIEVLAHFTAPGEDEPVTQAITYPYDLVMIEETRMPVSFTTTGDID